MFNRKEYIQWLEEKQKNANPHLQIKKINESVQFRRNEPIDMQEGPIFTGVRVAGKALRKSPLARTALLWGAAGAGVAAAKNLRRPRDPASGRLNDEDQPRSSLSKTAVKGAALGAAGYGLHKAYRSGMFKDIKQKVKDARRAYGRKKTAPGGRGPSPSSSLYLPRPTVKTK